MDSKNVLGQVIREAREATGLSQEKFAHAVNLDRTTISLLERGKQSPTVETLLKMSEVLQVKPSTLLGRMEKMLGDYSEGQGK